MLIHAQTYLCDDSVLLAGKEEPACNRGIQALIKCLTSHDDVRKFIRSNKEFTSDHLLFENIHFNHIGRETPLDRIKLKGICFSNSDLSKLRFRYTEIDDCTFLRSNLKQAYFGNCTIENTTFKQVDAQQSVFAGVTFKGGTDKGGTEKCNRLFITNTNMTGATFRVVSMHGVVIKNSFLVDSFWDRSDLTNLILSDCPPPHRYNYPIPSEKRRYKKYLLRF